MKKIPLEEYKTGNPPVFKIRAVTKEQILYLDGMASGQIRVYMGEDEKTLMLWRVDEGQDAAVQVVIDMNGIIEVASNNEDFAREFLYQVIQACPEEDDIGDYFDLEGAWDDDPDAREIIANINNN